MPAVFALLFTHVALAAEPSASLVGRFYAATDDAHAVRRFRAAPAIDRLFMAVSPTELIGYRLSGFSGRVASPGRIAVPGAMAVVHDYSFDPTRGGGSGGSSIPPQVRLADFDHDDRGIVYVAYDVWGFGMTDLTGNVVGHVQSLRYPWSVTSMRVDGRYYAVLTTSANAVIYDVTTPSDPALVRTIESQMTRFAQASNGDVALPTARGVEIFTGKAFVTGGDPKTVITTPATRYGSWGALSDGTRFFSFAHDVIGGRIATVVQTIDPDGDGYTLRNERTFADRTFWSAARAGDYLALSLGSDGRVEQFFPLLVRAGALTPLAISFQFQLQEGAAFGSAQIVPFSSGGATFVVATNGGTADLYALTLSEPPVRRRSAP